MDGTVDLLDVNVWLALGVPDHPRHHRARRYWYEESGSEVAFCRITALGFLRLTTHPVVMGDEPLTVPEAWDAYQDFRRLPEVILSPEPEGCERYLETWATGEPPSRHQWTDAYLAAFATAAAFRLVTFDRGFKRFPDLHLFRLEG